VAVAVHSRKTIWIAAAVLVATACSADAAGPAAPDDENESLGQGIWKGTVQDIQGYSEAAREAIVHWWMYGPDGRAEGGMSSVVVRL
jgi:hypothetical protein